MPHRKRTVESKPGFDEKIKSDCINRMTLWHGESGSDQLTETSSLGRLIHLMPSAALNWNKSLARLECKVEGGKA